jgi:hypothetical protein
VRTAHPTGVHAVCVEYASLARVLKHFLPLSEMNCR